MLQHTYLAVFWVARPGDVEARLLGWMKYGSYAVTAFIVISGYSLAVAVARGDGERRRRYSTLLPDRLRRLVPAYLVALAVALAVHAVLPRSPQPTLYDTGEGQSLTSVVVQALLLQDLKDIPLANYAFWSIAVELHVYVVLPVLLLLRRRLPMPVLVALALATAYGAVALSFADRLHPAYYGLFVLGVGVAIGTLGPKRPEWLGAVPWGALGLLLFAAVACANLVGGYEWAYRHQDLTHAVVGAGTASVLAGGTHGVGRVLSAAWLRWVGVVSYSVYLLHAPVIELLRRLYFEALDLAPGGWSLLLLQVTTFAVVIPLSALSYRFVERPFLSTTARRRGRAVEQGVTG